MKIKMMLCLALFLNTAISFAQKKNQDFVLTGQFKGLPDGSKVYLVTDDKDTVGKVISKGNQVVFKGRLPLDGRYHFIKFDTLVSKVFPSAIFLENKQIKVTGEIGKADIVVNGSSGAVHKIELAALESPIRSRQGAINDQSKQIQMKLSDSLSTAEKAELNMKLEEVKKLQKLGMSEFKETTSKWMASHKNSLFTPRLLSSYLRIFSLGEMEVLYTNLGPEAKASYYGLKLRIEIDGKKIKLGDVMPGFMLSTPTGESVSIKALIAKNKVTLIDFWASWCSPCRAAIPHLKEVYKEFNPQGFNIIGIVTAKNDKDAAWKKALTADHTPWDQGMDMTNVTDDLFPKDGIPSYILVDGSGKIIATNLANPSGKGMGKQGPEITGEGLKKTLEGLLAK
jgi:thiol-disulfide isomerase/thioredoxin